MATAAVEETKDTATTENDSEANPVLLKRRTSVDIKSKKSHIKSIAYSKKLLEKMSIKELGVLLSCLMPLAKISELKYLIGAEAKNLIIKKD